MKSTHRKLEFPLLKEFRFGEEKIYALYEVIRPQEYLKKAKCDCEKSDMSRLTRRRTTNQLRLEFIERNDVIHFCSLPLGELMMLILDVYSQRTVPPGE